ncbi:flavin-binding monooxygenase [Apiospora marii]|uniref:Flavin-binding monooxygenase n=1 Tax=Apiospora marii TaxID=335849 RepID=A0ABR1S9M9_9PEZI
MAPRYEGAPAPEAHDVVIVGAGISGINCAYRMQTAMPSASFVVLESRGQLGGTWDLFQFPGARADTDLPTYGFSWYPWPFNQSVAEGPAIMSYLTKAVSEHNLQGRIRFRHKVISANWSSKEKSWSLVVTSQGSSKFFQARFLVLGAGYYDYEAPLPAEVPGLRNFQGAVIHPQFWPAGFEYEGKRIAIIGSGSTATTIFPEIAKKAAKTTMIQRSPSYIHSGNLATRLPQLPSCVSRWFPQPLAQRLERLYFIVVPYLLVQFCLRFPALARSLMRREAAQYLPPRIRLEPHFEPRYNVWEQRPSISPDGEFFRAFHRPGTELVTGEIEAVTDRQILMSGGESLDVDVIVTATGFRLKLGGDIDLRVDGESVSLKGRLIWNRAMFEGIPNLVYMIGYERHSWTFGVDNTAIILTRLIRHMSRNCVTAAVPWPPKDMAGSSGTEPFWQLSSTYCTLANGELPIYGKQGHWKHKDKPPIDWLYARWGNITEDMMFSV